MTPNRALQDPILCSTKQAEKSLRQEQSGPRAGSMLRVRIITRFA
jgi:hypothetical protein